jgi:hypothetical protein
VQGFVKGRAFFQPLNCECPELESPFGAADAPATRCWIRTIEGFDDRIRQGCRQRRALIPGNVDEPPAIASIAPQPQWARGTAWLDAKDL